MKLESKRERLQTVAQRFKEVYGTVGMLARYPERAETIRQLEALNPESSTPLQVEKIIGNRSWTDPTSCSECRSQDGRAVVRLGEDPDYESSTAWICLECLEKAMELAREA
jgi:hypothetical protein